jgi:hypothetical protein
MPHQPLPPRFENLPFVGDPQSSHAPYWTLPASGGYCAGYETGRDMALAFLKFLRQGDHSAGYVFYLSRIALSFFSRIDDQGGLGALNAGQYTVQLDSLRGQFFGFFNELGAWLGTACRDDAQHLDTLNFCELCKRAAAALENTSLPDEDGPEEVWLTEIDMAGSCPPLEQIHELLSNAPLYSRQARPAARMFWFLFGMYHGRLLHEHLTEAEPEIFGRFLEEL